MRERGLRTRVHVPASHAGSRRSLGVHACGAASLLSRRLPPSSQSLTSASACVPSCVQVPTRSVRQLVEYYYAWKMTSRFKQFLVQLDDLFVTKFRTDKRRLHLPRTR